ncbi:MAG: toprim domain-containing protein, partial [Patescibacteria group bacterium]
HPQAKYLNSPETVVFDKSRALCGIDRAREGIRRLGAPVLVEGQVDLLMAHQAGFDNAVATSGTAFTENHAEILKRYSPNLLISYDGDRAGIAAAGRAAALALAAGVDVKVAKLPPGVDPADLVKEDPAGYKDAIKNALHIVDFYLTHITDAKYDPRTFRLEVSRVVLPYIALIRNAIDRAHFVKRVAEALAVPEQAVASEVAKLGTPSAEPKALEKKDALAPVRSAEPFLSRADVIERLIEGLVALFTEHGETGEAERAKGVLKESGVLGRDIVAADEPDADTRAALFEADFFLERHVDPEERKRALDEVYADFVRESIHERYRETLALLRVAEKSGDNLRITELMKGLSELAVKLR